MVTADSFRFLRARSLVLGLFGFGLFFGLLLDVLEAVRVLPLQPDDPILAPALYTLTFVSLCGWIVRRCRSRRLRLRYLMGTLPSGYPWRHLLGLMAAVFIFSLAAFQLSYYGLSWIMPSLVESTLQKPLLLSAADTAAPGLYNGLTLFSVLLVAPVTEEFLFRGILLHRWGSKWGIGPAVVLTSVLFGLLHMNLVGLFVFGLVLALLYLHSRTLWVPILAHALNNAIASSLELATSPTRTTVAMTTLEEFRAGWWLALLLLLLSAPWVGRYIYRSWPRQHTQLPYFANRQQREG
ncbi:CPBP family intramembrane glutamic endopeptidase [Halomicronema hongdechloris]|nr:CPBP family intramembrane glutamic endopeptidase [Halomicronema hongdechloris]